MSDRSYPIETEQATRCSRNTPSLRARGRDAPEKERFVGAGARSCLGRYRGRTLRSVRQQRVLRALTEGFQSPRSSKCGSHSGRWIDPPIEMAPRKGRLINTTDCRRSSLIGSIDDRAFVSCKPDDPPRPAIPCGPKFRLSMSTLVMRRQFIDFPAEPCYARVLVSFQLGRKRQAWFPTSSSKRVAQSFFMWPVPCPRKESL